MKRALILVFALVLGLGLAAFADGFYAQITTDPLAGTPNMILETGFGWYGTFTSTPNIGLGLDLYTQVDNILGTGNLWNWGFLVSVQGTEITLDLGMDFGFEQTAWPGPLSLDQWVTTATITGHPGDITQVWGTINLTYEGIGPNPDWYFGLVPSLELGVRVDIPFGTPF